MGRLRRIIDYISMTTVFVKTNWRLVVVASIGLILALGTISQTNIVLESYRDRLFQDYVESTTQSADWHKSDFYIDINQEYMPFNISNELNAAIDFCETTPINSATSLEMVDYLDRIIWHHHVDAKTWFLEQEETSITTRKQAIAIHTIDNTTLNSLTSFLEAGALPDANDEIILIYERNDLPNLALEIGDQLNLTTVSEDVTKNVSVTVSGIVIYDWEERYTAIGRRNWAFPSFWELFDITFQGPVVVAPRQSFSNIVDQIYSGNSNYTLSTTGSFFLDLSKIDSFNLFGEEITLRQYKEQLKLDFISSFSTFRISSPLLERIQTFEPEFITTLTLMLLFSLPILAVILFLVSYSLSLVKRRRRTEIGVLKSHGGTDFQVFIMLLGETLVTSLIAIIIGSLLGIPISEFILTTTDFLVFSGSSGNMIFNPQVFQFTSVTGFLCAFFLNLGNIISLSRMEIIEAGIPKEMGEPFWKRIYLDISVFGLGLIGTLLLLIIRQILLVFDLANVQFIYIFAYSPFFVVIGGALVVSRIYEPVLARFSKLLWRIEGGLLAFGFKNMLQRSKPAVRSLLLISIAVAFAISSLIVPITIQHNQEDTYKYRIGSDLLVEGDLRFNDTIYNYLTTDLESSVKSVCPISFARAVNDPIKIMGVDIRTFNETVFFRADFIADDVISFAKRLDLNAMFEAMFRNNWRSSVPTLNMLLNNLQYNMTVAVLKENLRTRNLAIGETLSLVLSEGEGETQREKLFEFLIGGEFSYWPGFILEPLIGTNQAFTYLVANLSTVEQLVSTPYFTASSVDYLVHLRPSNSSHEEVAKQIHEFTGRRVQVTQKELEQLKENSRWLVLVTVINGGVIMLSLVIIFAVLMFGFSQLLERGKEIGVERAFGMNLSQTFFLFLLESIILLAVGLMVGGVMGVFLAQQLIILAMVAMPFYMIPPFIMVYPWVLILQMGAVLIIITLVGSILPAYLATKTKISNILRIE
ncbi:MAG: ABC transporter permease [Candidatus Hodarchaeota archaeon]